MTAAKQNTKTSKPKVDESTADFWLSVDMNVHILERVGVVEDIPGLMWDGPYVVAERTPDRVLVKSLRRRSIPSWVDRKELAESLKRGTQHACKERHKKNVAFAQTLLKGYEPPKREKKHEQQKEAAATEDAEADRGACADQVLGDSADCVGGLRADSRTGLADAVARKERGSSVGSVDRAEPESAA